MEVQYKVEVEIASVGRGYPGHRTNYGGLNNPCNFFDVRSHNGTFRRPVAEKRAEQSKHSKVRSTPDLPIS